MKGPITYEEYLKLHQEKKKLSAQLDEIKADISEMEEQLLSKFEEDGLTSVKLGPATLWLDHKIWASAGGDTENAVRALEQAGVESLVQKTINRTTLSAWVREFAGPLDTPEQIQAALPHDLGKAIKVTETNNIRVRGI